MLPELAASDARAAFTLSVGGSVAHGQLEAAEPLEESFYEQEFDAVRHALEQIPEEGVNQVFIDFKVGQRMLQLDVLMEKLSKQVMENHEEMVKGMELVMELEKDMQVSTIISKNGRRHLSSAMHEVSQDIVVSANVKKRQVLMEMLPLLERIQHIIDLKAQLESTVEEGSYAKALQICSECMLLLDDFSELSAIKEINHSIEEWLQRTMHNIDDMLQGVCRKFHEERFAIVVDAYYVIDDASSLAEKVQTFFAQMAVLDTHVAIKGLINQGEDSQVARKRNRLPYNELRLQIPEGKFRQALSKILETLYDLMCSHYQMMVWKPCQGSTGEGVREDHANDASLMVKDSLHSDGQDLKVGIRDGSGAANGVENSFKQIQWDTVSVVQRALNRGRKPLWELISQRITALLGADAFFTISPHHFLQCLEWVNTFVLAGEAFCGSEAISLRSRLVKLSEKYFGSFHRQNLEVLRMMLEKESWQQLSPAATKAVNLSGLTCEGPLVLGSSHVGISTLEDQPKGREQSPASLNRSLRTGFGEWLLDGNPFSEKHAQFAHGPSSKRDSVENGTLDLLSISNGTGKEDQGQEEDEDDEDLFADFIDEESQLPSRLSSNYQRSYSLGRGRERPGTEESLILTGASVSFLRYIDRYVKLMQILQPVSSEVFKGLCQLFELYFFTIFRTFGQQDAVVGAQGQSMTTAGITVRLRITLGRMFQGLEEQQMKLAEVKTGPQGASDSPVTFPGKAGSLMSMPNSNRYGLKEGFVAMESLIFIAHVMRKSRARFQALQPQDFLPAIEHFYSRTVDAVSDLKEHVYKTVARLHLDVGGYVEKIASAKWDLRGDLGLQHNGHIDLLLGEYKKFCNRVKNGDVPKEVHDLLLEYGIDIIAEIMVEGLSRVKKCNNEGRALMSLDVQVLINGLQHLAPQWLRPNLQIVETYIKAFYLPETEYLHWIRKHPEYTKTQIVGLINLVAATNNWKRRSRLDLVEKVEAGDIYQ